MDKRIVHGMWLAPEYEVWRKMRDRCYNPNVKAFHRYGGRGIKVCDRWRHDFAKFFSDMGPRPSSKYSIERINNDLGYNPENCKWATREEQHRNTKNNRLLTYRGETKPLIVWAEEYGLKWHQLRGRLRHGWEIGRALTDPLNPKKVHPARILTFNGETMTVREWANKLGFEYRALTSRLHRGWSVERTLTQPVNLSIAKWHRGPR